MLNNGQGRRWGIQRERAEIEKLGRAPNFHRHEGGNEVSNLVRDSTDQRGPLITQVRWLDVDKTRRKRPESGGNWQKVSAGFLSIKVRNVVGGWHGLLRYPFGTPLSGHVLQGFHLGSRKRIYNSQQLWLWAQTLLTLYCTFPFPTSMFLGTWVKSLPSLDNLPQSASFADTYSLGTDLGPW